jgi:hypothetical protein
MAADWEGTTPVRILGTVASIVIGGAVAAVTVIGLVSSQTGTTGENPANVNQPIIDYGTSSTE